MLFRIARLIPLLALSAVVAAASASESTQSAAQATSAANSPSVTQGILGNGLRYFILPHVSAKEDVSLRLIVRAGSLDERDDERGFAHFVEHMAFRGTRSHPVGGIRQTFEKLGLAFGADLNARTQTTHTTYLMDLPAGKTGGLNEAFALLRGFADGISFQPDQVEREKGVVLSELRTRDTPTQRAARDVEAALYAGTAIATRYVTGVPEQIHHTSAEQLRAYYERNYSPPRMALVVVGAVDPAAVSAMIEATFGSMRPAPTAAAPAAEPAPPEAGAITTHLLVVPNSPGALVDFVHIHRQFPDDAAGRRLIHHHAIALNAIDARLRARQDRMSPSLGSTNAEQTPGACPALVHDTVTATAVFARWREAVAFIETELRRIRLHGFSETEVAEAIAVTRAERRSARSLFAGFPAGRIADELERAVQAQQTWRPPTEALADFERAAADLSARAVGDAAVQAFAGQSGHLVVRTPLPIEGGDAAVLASLATSAGQPVAAEMTNDPELTFAYPESGLPGALVTRAHATDLNLEQATFANGVQVNIQPSVLEPERFRLRVSFAQNASNVPAKRPGLVELASMTYLGAHVGSHTDTEILRLLAIHGVTRQLEVTRSVLTINFSGQASELPFTLALVAAFMRDLRLDPAVYPVAFSRYNHFFTAQLSDLSQLSMSESLYRAGSRDPRLRLPSPADVARYQFPDVQQWISTYLVNGPLEIGIVGDVTIEETLAAAAITVGNLPARVPPPPSKPLSKSRRGRESDLTARTVAGSASTSVMWPLTNPDEPRGNAALAVAMNVLSDRLRATLRDQLGATYTPSTGVRRDRRQPDFGFAWVTTTFAPTEASELTRRSLAIARQLAKDGVTAEEFTRLKEPVRSRYLAELRSNAWWLDVVVANAQQRPEGLAEARTHRTIVDELSLADVNDAARLFATRATVTIVRPNPQP